ncbi:aldehyde dehydrogenase family protein, partial [Acinetobacter baumannii]
GATLVAGGLERPMTQVGSMITQAHYDKVTGYIRIGLEEGATLVAGGLERPAGLPAHLSKGQFIQPTVFADVDNRMRIAQEEIFGPVLCVVRVNSLEEAMQLINDHEYGNGTCIFTRDGEAARLFCDEIEVGMVGVNVPLPVPVAYHSFGGWKRSLFGDLHAYGTNGVRFYTRRKAITQRWPQRASHEASQFAFPSL